MTSLALLLVSAAFLIAGCNAGCSYFHFDRQYGSDTVTVRRHYSCSQKKTYAEAERYCAEHYRRGTLGLLDNAAANTAAWSKTRPARSSLMFSRHCRDSIG